MNSPNPIPPQTPLPGQWNSAIIRQIAYAGLGLVATILADIFNLSTTAFLERGGRVLDAVLGFIVIAYPLWLAYRARLNNPTPPIAGTPAVEKSIVREELIESAPTAGTKNAAAKCSAISVIVAGILAIASVVTVGGISGCATSPTAPITAAQTTPQRGYAVAGLYSILQASALDLMRSADTPAAVKTAIADADAKASPVMLQLTQALKLYTSIDATVGAASGARAAEATAKIDEWLAKAQPLVENLRRVLGGTKPTALMIEPRGSPALALAWSDAR